MQPTTQIADRTALKRCFYSAAYGSVPLSTCQVADWRIGEGIGAAPIARNNIVYEAKAGGDWDIRGQMLASKIEDGSAPPS